MTLTGPKRVVSIWDLKSAGVISSKNPALKLPALLTSTSMRPNRSTADWTAFLGFGFVGHVEPHRQEVVVLAQGGSDGVGVAGGGDDRVPGCKRGPCDVGAQAARSTRNKIDLRLTHAIALLCRRIWSMSTV